MFITQTVNNSINRMDEKNRKVIILRIATLILLSLFLAYNSIIPFLPDAYMNMIYIAFFVLIFIFYFVLSKIIFPYYDIILKFLILKFTKDRIKLTKENKSFVWFVPSLLMGICSIFLLSIFSYLINLEENILDLTINYTKIAVSINSIVLPTVTILSLLLILILQSYFLVKKEKVEWFLSITSSLVSLMWCSFITTISVIIARFVLGAI